MDFDKSIEVPAGQDLRQWTLILPERAGVYLLWGQERQPILLAIAGAVRSTVRRKLQPSGEQTPGWRAELAQITKGVSWTQANSQFVAYLQFHELARKLYPQSYQKMLGWPDAWWVKICLSERFGRLLATQALNAPGGDEYLGPFPSAKEAKGLIDLATDIFGLCRDYEIIQQTSVGRSAKTCTYAQMNKCCGLCLGKISAEQYRLLLEEVLGLAQPQKRLRQQQHLQEKMKWAAEKLDFESAANCKKLLKRLAELESKGLPWADSVRKFHYLVIAPGQDRHHIQPWRVYGGGVQPGQQEAVAQIEQHIAQITDWVRQAEQYMPEAPDKIQHWRGTISLVSYFLFRSHSDKCLYYKADQLPAAGELAEQIAAKFCPDKTSKPKAGL